MYISVHLYKEVGTAKWHVYVLYSMYRALFLNVYYEWDDKMELKLMDMLVIVV